MLRLAAAAAAAHAARHAPAASSRGIFALCAPQRFADLGIVSRLTRPRRPRRRTALADGNLGCVACAVQQRQPQRLSPSAALRE